MGYGVSSGLGLWGQTDFQVNLKIGLTPRGGPREAM